MDETKVIEEIAKLARELGEKSSLSSPQVEENLLACAAVWHETDREFSEWAEEDLGDFSRFCYSYFKTTESERHLLFKKLERHLSVIYLHALTVFREVRREHDLDSGRPLAPEDTLIAGYSPLESSQMELRRSKLHALVQLNFAYTLSQEPVSKIDWAMRRLAEGARRKPPKAVAAKLRERVYLAENFTSSFNIYLNQIYLRDGNPIRVDKRKVSAYWGKRAELAVGGWSHENFARRWDLGLVWESIVRGEFPKELIDSDRYTWRVGEDTITDPKTGDTVESTPIGHAPWDLFREVVVAQRGVDPHLEYGNYYEDTFSARTQISDEKVLSLIHEVLTSQSLKRVVRELEQYTGGQLTAFDLHNSFGWQELYSSDSPLDFKEPQDLEAALPMILGRVGFNQELIDELVPRLAVERSRGPGHAFWPGHERDKAYVRCRVSSEGMTRGEFSVFLHELGHAVEMVFSSFEREHQVLRGVPCPAITEAFAMFFQKKIHAVLEEPEPSSIFPRAYRTLFFLCHTGGSALCEIRLYQWLYQQKEVPEGKAIHDRILEIEEEIWRQYFASLFGERSFCELSGWGHIFWGTFYLHEYFMGELISWQISQALEKADDVGQEIKRMCRIGKVSPDHWMKEAIGESISLQGLLETIGD